MLSSILVSDTTQPSVAYFSAEFAIGDELPTFAGGLGILAADLLMEAGAGGRAFWGVSLAYCQPFTDSSATLLGPDIFKRSGFERLTDKAGGLLIVHVPLAGRSVAVSAWQKSFGSAKLILLDVRLEANTSSDRHLCDRLYPAGRDIQVAQEMCLGLGGVAMLRAVGAEPSVYHLNEGHTVMAGMALALELMRHKPGLSFAQARDGVRKRVVATKHTILAGAGVILPWSEAERHLAPVLATVGAKPQVVAPWAQTVGGEYSDTKLMLSLAGRACGVSQLHVDQEKEKHPDSPLVAVTNGIYACRWWADGRNEAAGTKDDVKLWDWHVRLRSRMVDYVRAKTGVGLDDDCLTVIWARRMASYKRPELLLHDMARLNQLMENPRRPIQFIVAGAANPADEAGVVLEKKLEHAARELASTNRFAYLPHYDLQTASLLTQGADVWLNTPIRGFEACGTSGMKAAGNGALLLSTTDGWTDEVDLDAIGWELPPGDDLALYDVLEQSVAAAYYDENGRSEAWIGRMRAAMELIEREFTTRRVLCDYDRRLYRPIAVRET